MKSLTLEQVSILEHTSSTGRYVTGSRGREWMASIAPMIAAGWLFDHGPQSLAGGMHYLVMTSKGRSRLIEHRKAICIYPQPKPLTRSQIRAKERWREYSESGRGDCGISFRSFLREKGVAA